VYNESPLRHERFPFTDGAQTDENVPVLVEISLEKEHGDEYYPRVDFAQKTSRKDHRHVQTQRNEVAVTIQAISWIATALTKAEKGFRRLSGYADMPLLTTALNAEHQRRTPARIAA
jgi:hypothetical protein